MNETPNAALWAELTFRHYRTKLAAIPEGLPKMVRMTDADADAIVAHLAPVGVQEWVAGP